MFFWSHYGVISRKLLIKSRNQNVFSVFKMPLNSRSNAVYSLLGSVSSFKNYWWGGGGAPKVCKKHLFKFKKELFSPLFKRESSCSNAFVASLKHSIVFGENILMNVHKQLFLKICFFSQFKIPFYTFVIGQPKLFQMIVSGEFLKRCETEAFLKFNEMFIFY